MVIFLCKRFDAWGPTIIEPRFIVEKKNTLLNLNNRTYFYFVILHSNLLIRIELFGVFEKKGF